jgi:hypothetical protein
VPKQIVVSYSELDTYRQCPLKHLLAYKQRWTKDKAEDSALGKGTLWHKVMEAHYETLKMFQNDPAVVTEREILKVARAAVTPLLFGDRGKQTEVQELMEWMYEGHIERYGKDGEFTIVGIELGPHVPLPWPNGRPSHYVLKTKLDLLVKDGFGELWIIDHKSGANKPTQFELQVDDQFGLYTWAVQRLGYKVSGSIHSYARTTRNTGDYPDAAAKYKPQTLDQRFERYYLNRSDRELKALADDAFAAARNAYPPKGMALPLYSAPDPRNCGWKCDFKEAHLMLREGLSLEHVMKSEGFHQDFTRH